PRTGQRDQGFNEGRTQRPVAPGRSGIILHRAGWRFDGGPATHNDGCEAGFATAVIHDASAPRPELQCVLRWPEVLNVRSALGRLVHQYDCQLETPQLMRLIIDLLERLFQKSAEVRRFFWSLFSRVRECATGATAFVGSPEIA